MSVANRKQKQTSLPKTAKPIVSELTEASRQELSFLLAANPRPGTSAEAFVIWVCWCLQWEEMTKKQATEALENARSLLLLAVGEPTQPVNPSQRQPLSLPKSTKGKPFGALLCLLFSFCVTMVSRTIS